MKFISYLFQSVILRRNRREILSSSYLTKIKQYNIILYSLLYCFKFYFLERIIPHPLHIIYIFLSAPILNLYLLYIFSNFAMRTFYFFSCDSSSIPRFVTHSLTHVSKQGNLVRQICAK